jgi:hypothetical protein
LSSQSRASRTTRWRPSTRSRHVACAEYAKRGPRDACAERRAARKEPHFDRSPLRNPKPYLVVVSVVVVVVGPGIEVDCDVVDVVWVGVLEQADSEAMAMARAGMISFFMGMVVV